MPIGLSPLFPFPFPWSVVPTMPPDLPCFTSPRRVHAEEGKCRKGLGVGVTVLLCLFQFAQLTRHLRVPNSLTRSGIPSGNGGAHLIGTPFETMGPRLSSIEASVQLSGEQAEGDSGPELSTSLPSHVVKRAKTPEAIRVNDALVEIKLPKERCARCILTGGHVGTSPRSTQRGAGHVR